MVGRLKTELVARVAVSVPPKKKLSLRYLLPPIS